jgi:phage head maturation protease
VKDDKWEKRNWKEHRRITKFAKLIDMSLVTYAAYESTSVAMRSANRPNDDYKKDLAEMEKDSMKLDLEMIKNKTK